MSWTNYLDRLRALPEHKRQRLLWFWTILLTLIIAVLWLLSWRYWAPSASAEVPRQDWSTRVQAVKLQVITGWQSLTNKTQ